MYTLSFGFLVLLHASLCMPLVGPELEINHFVSCIYLGSYFDTFSTWSRPHSVIKPPEIVIMVMSDKLIHRISLVISLYYMLNKDISWSFNAEHSTEDILKYFFLFFPENRIWRFMQIVSNGDNLHEMSNLFSRKNKKRMPLMCRLLK